MGDDGLWWIYWRICIIRPQCVKWPPFVPTHTKLIPNVNHSALNTGYNIHKLGTMLCINTPQSYLYPRGCKLLPLCRFSFVFSLLSIQNLCEVMVARRSRQFLVNRGHRTANGIFTKLLYAYNGERCSDASWGVILYKSDPDANF